MQCSNKPHVPNNPTLPYCTDLLNSLLNCIPYLDLGQWLTPSEGEENRYCMGPKVNLKLSLHNGERVVPTKKNNEKYTDST